MTPAKTAEYRAKLQQILDDLSGQDDLGQEGQKTVMLDQQSVGRLSRMDALQQQAMARATQQRRDQQRLRVRAALTRIDEDEFGYCLDCGEEISDARLELDPAVPKCLSCARG